MNHLDILQDATGRKPFLKITLANASSISPPKLLAKIRERWPLFDEPPKPLAIGITGHVVRGLNTDWEAELIAHCLVSTVLAAVTRRREYLAILQAGSPRYALDGNVDGCVTEGDESHAKCILHEIETTGYPQ
jgi:sRNA-binding protein